MVATSTPEMKRLREQQEPLKRTEKKKKATIANKLFVELRDDDSASDISLNDLIENESGLEDETESDANALKLDVVGSVSVGDYVVVEFAKKCSKCYYVGRVTKERDEEDDVEVEFLRKKGQCFVKPVVPELSSVHVNNLKAVLAEPSVRGTTARTKGELIFNVNFGSIDIR